MSIYSTIQQSTNSLRISEVGLQVTGNNIANANTPGYIRQELIQSAAGGYSVGGLVLGMGARADGVVQILDQFTFNRMQQAGSDVSYSATLIRYMEILEQAYDELGDRDLSSFMSRFSAALQELSNQPGDRTLRSVVVERAVELTEAIRSIASTAVEFERQADREIRVVAEGINRLTDRIDELNRRIVATEGGGTIGSQAVSLRDDRLQAISELSQLVDIRMEEEQSGSMSIFVGGDYLVSSSGRRIVAAMTDPDPERAATRPQMRVELADTGTPLRPRGGELAALYEVRSGLAGDSLRRLNELSQGIVQTVNRLHAEGQAAEGFAEVRSEGRFTALDSPLEMNNLIADLDNGSFAIRVFDRASGNTEEYRVDVRSLGLAGDTTPNSLLAAINAIPGVQATLSGAGELQLRASAPNIRFSFADDSSGFLAAMGINTFLTGRDALSVQVRPELVRDPNLLAISLGGPGEDNLNALRLAQVFEQADVAGRSSSLRDEYQGLIVNLSQRLATERGISRGRSVYFQTLESIHLGVSGVNLDEEAIKMMLYQRNFQAMSKLITTANELLDTLLRI